MKKLITVFARRDAMNLESISKEDQEYIRRRGKEDLQPLLVRLSRHFDKVYYDSDREIKTLHRVRDRMVRMVDDVMFGREHPRRAFSKMIADVEILVCLLEDGVYKFLMDVMDEANEGAEAEGMAEYSKEQ